MVKVNYSELEDALMFASAATDLGDGGAFIDSETGEIWLICDGAPEPWPEDVFENERYLPLPDQRDFDLGSPLVFRFASRFMSDKDEDKVRDMFRAPGAYRRFDDLIDKRGLRDKWHQYRDDAQREALTEWCAENGIELEG
ncbi:hypothetical protein [Oceanimonas marisflavi]|uniref:hypothetical protein n=1 Tax=Oceanimonas marisflavi TaxID=2059724 RepID=UPI000D302BA9|nr:hypothetical protein [Oceanimonas marisflavi]